MTKPTQNPVRAIVIGASAGGVAALQILLARLPSTFPVPILIAQHLPSNINSKLTAILSRACSLHVKEAEEGEKICAGVVYLAAANYHLLVELDGTLSLSVDAHVSFARPSIDILFESAALAFGHDLVAVILSGANADGSAGIKKVAERGGITIVQDPVDAEMPSMPRAALAVIDANYVLPLLALGTLLRELGMAKERTGHHAIGS